MQNFEFRKSDHHRPSDRDINDGNNDRKTLRCRTGILALTSVSKAKWPSPRPPGNPGQCPPPPTVFSAHARPAWGCNNTASYWMMRSSFRVLIGWFCDPTWGGGALAPLPPRRAASSLVYFTTTRWPDGFYFYLNSSPPTNKTQTKRAL